MLRVTTWQAKYNNYIGSILTSSYIIIISFEIDSFTNIKLELLNKDTTPYISPLTFKIFETFNIDSQGNWDREQVHSTCSSQNTDDMRQKAEANIRPRKGYKCEEDLQQQVWMFTSPLPIVKRSNFSSVVAEVVGKMSMVH